MHSNRPWLLAAALILPATFCPPLHAGFIGALHQGSNDPETEGWTKFRPFVGVATSPVSNDLGLGIDAWAIDDNDTSGSGNGIYGVNLSASQIGDATTLGWTLTTILRVVDSVDDLSLDTPIRVAFLDGATIYSLNFGQESDGSLLLKLEGAGVLDLEDLDGSDYHRYELVFSPAAGSADLFIDGTLRFSSYTGTASAPKEANVFFGSTFEGGTGHANYNLVRFDVVPEPGSFLLAALGALGVCTCARRRRAFGSDTSVA